MGTHATIAMAEQTPVADSWRLSASAVEARSSRVRFRALLDAMWSDPDSCDAAETCFGEVIANAVIHGMEPIHVDVLLETEDVTFDVTDADSTVPMPRDAGVDAEDGRGMELLSALCRRWEVFELTGQQGKCVRVWCSARPTKPDAMAGCDG